MTVDIATLAIRIDSMEAREAARDLDRLRTSGRGAEQQADALSGVMKKLAGVFAAMKIVDAAEALIKTQREFDKLNASLVTATGSAGNAAQAFGALQSFAASTPYGLAEVTKAFIQLRNLGLTPSERALNSYGNTASAMGKSLNQMVEAVADAATGEFERLKEFGIKAKQNGDQVSLTFQGVTSNIGNNAASIEKYLLNLGETKFAGGMELQAKTLDGAISNLGDTWDMTKLAFSQSGFGDGAMAGVLALSNALQDLQAILRATGLAASEEAKVVSEAGGLHKALATVFETVAVVGENVALVFRGIGREIGGIAAQAVAFATGDFKGAGAIHDQMVADAEEDRRMTDARVEKILWAAAVEQKVRENAAAEKDREGRDDLARYAVQQTAAGQSAEAAKKAAAEYAAAVKAANDFITAMKIEASEVGLSTDQVKMMAAARAAAKAPTAALRMEIMSGALALDIAVKAGAAKAEADKAEAAAAEGVRAAVSALNDERAASYAAAASELAANQRAIETFGMTKAQIEELEVARLKDRLAQRAALELSEDDIAQTERMIEVKTRNADALKRLADLQAAQKGAEELSQFLDPAKAQSFGDALRDAFGGAGSALAKLTSSFQVYTQKQAEFDKQRDNAEKKRRNGLGTEADYIKDITALNRMQTSERLGSYGDMASAAAGFFNEQSNGYKVLQGVSQAFHVAQLAMNLASIGPAIAAGAAQMFAQSGWGGFAGVAAMLGVMAALGAATSGGGGPSAKQRQETQGTGSVLGDSSAKSDSIARAIELAATNSSIELTHTAGMLASLKAIENSISGLGNLLVRGSGLTGYTAGTVYGGATAAMSSIFKVADVTFSLVDKLTGGLSTKITNAIFGGKKSVEDTGLLLNSTTLGAAATGGVSSFQYSDIKKDGGLFHRDKYSTETSALGAEADAQFAKVLVGLGASVTEAAKLLGVGGDEFTARLNTFVIDIGKISLKGLTGEEIQQQLEAVFSKLGDDLAQFGVAGLEQFQQVGEGYFETLTRVATNYANLNSIMESIGTTFGATGMASIAARENLIALAGGIDELASQTSSFAENFLSKAEQLAPVQKYVTDQLAAMGLQSLTTRDQFKDYVLGLASSGALATEAGATQYTALLALADAFAKTHAATEDLTKTEQEIAEERKDLQQKLNELTMTSVQLMAKEREGIAAVNLVLYDQVKALEAFNAVGEAQANVQTAYYNQRNALQEIIDLRLKEAEATQKQIDALKLGDLSTLSPEQKYAEAQRQFDAAAPGDAKNAAAQTLLTASRSYNGSTEAYARDYAKVQAILGLQAASQKSAATVAQQQLDALDKQIGELVEINAGVSKRDSTMIELQKAILGLGSAMLALANANTVAGKPNVGNGASLGQSAVDGVLTGIYKDLLGRAPDVDGLKFWEGVAASGQTYDQIVAGFKGSDEYKALHGSHANGLEFVPFDGYRAELHRGERVQTASQVVNGDKASAETNELLREVIAQLQADKEQRGAVAMATLKELKTVSSTQAATKRELARAE
jgi:hypothetical protein